MYFTSFIRNETKSLDKTSGNGHHSHAMATRAMAGGVACLARRRWVKAAARHGHQGHGRRRGVPGSPAMGQGGGWGGQHGAARNCTGATRCSTGGPERRRGGVPVD